ncbi:MAG TPA: dihydrolipoyllysine-residue acetyltransferase [Burkholderiales bacterium]|nr:dihydrolipoyllysine-residue acetyltransferase [Burkholderiales bacterium]
MQEVLVPDIGDFKDVPIIEVLVKPGDRVKPDDSLVTLESDKATMEVPAPFGGVVQAMKVKVGDRVSQGSLILTLETGEAGTATAGAPAAAAASAPAPAPAATPSTLAAAWAPVPPAAVASAPAPAVSPAAPTPAVPASMTVDEAGFARAHASPAVRRFARELGLDLARVKGTGPKGRVLKEDVQGFVKQALARPAAAGPGLGFALPAMPAVDFAKFGPIEAKPLARIKKISGAYLHRNWVAIPHVTQHDEADITEMEAFRKQMAEEVKAQGIRVTPLAFLMKACVAALQRFPQFNASLSPEGDSLILKQYWHLGVAVDTPNGLVVPVIRDVDKKGVLQLAKELGEVSAKAREGKLSPADMQGGTFSISSLGGIGGSSFTPIINAPEVAILGASRSVTRPQWRDGGFVPRLMLPLSLSYDHRVVDGAEGARFITFLTGVLSDIRRLVL